MNTAAAKLVPASELATVTAGDVVIVASPSLRKPRTLTVTATDERHVYVTSGKPWGSGRIRGGVIQVRDGALAYQPTMLQPYVEVATLSVVKAAEA